MDRLKASRIANMNGMTALITGGGTGIGLIIAKAFASNGAKVYITGRRVAVLEQTAAGAKSIGLTLIPLQLDVNDKKSIAEAVEVINSTEGKLDVLVNNAGIPGPFSAIEDPKPSGKTYGGFIFNNETISAWHEVLTTNTIAPFFMTMAFLDLLEKGARSRGETTCVINVSSAAAYSRITINAYAYGVSKAGIENLTRCMATEFARRDIPVRVNSLVPGLFASQFTRESEEETDKMCRLPLPGALAPSPVRRAGRQEEMALAALYLASPGGGYSNGTALLLDGGWATVNL